MSSTTYTPGRVASPAEWASGVVATMMFGGAALLNAMRGEGTAARSKRRPAGAEAVLGKPMPELGEGPAAPRACRGGRSGCGGGVGAAVAFLEAGAVVFDNELHLLGRALDERISLIGGSFNIESAPGKGTTLYVRVPVGGSVV